MRTENESLKTKLAKAELELSGLKTEIDQSKLRSSLFDEIT